MSELTMTSEAYNQMSFEQVDRSGLKTNVECPDCGMQATRRDFEACHSGSVNQHYSLDCSCGYHECDQDMCSKCEQSLDVDNDSSMLAEMLTTLMENLRDQRRIHPVDLSLLKLYAVKNVSSINDFFSRTKRDLSELSYEMKFIDTE
ncbi:hypothetical protein [Vibrio sp. 10N]|uniref:hypothetical protein n=1 Tax=Vibrio sp. 10N TaxID=3058938 RepID=UPI0028136FDD|nr:hypothetical protein VB10N_46380 [Vibrio sp. 10N]